MVPFSAHIIRDAVDIHAMLSNPDQRHPVGFTPNADGFPARLYRLKRSRFPGTNGRTTGWATMSDAPSGYWAQFTEGYRITQLGDWRDGMLPQGSGFARHHIG